MEERRNALGHGSLHRHCMLKDRTGYAFYDDEFMLSNNTVLNLFCDSVLT